MNIADYLEQNFLDSYNYHLNLDNLLHLISSRNIDVPKIEDIVFYLRYKLRLSPAFNPIDYNIAKYLAELNILNKIYELLIFHKLYYQVIVDVETRENKDAQIVLLKLDPKPTPSAKVIENKVSLLDKKYAELIEKSLTKIWFIQPLLDFHYSLVNLKDHIFATADIFNICVYHMISDNIVNFNFMEDAPTLKFRYVGEPEKIEDISRQKNNISKIQLISLIRTHSSIYDDFMKSYDNTNKCYKLASELFYSVIFFIAYFYEFEHLEVPRKSDVSNENICLGFKNILYMDTKNAPTQHAPTEQSSMIKSHDEKKHLEKIIDINSQIMEINQQLEKINNNCRKECLSCLSSHAKYMCSRCKKVDYCSRECQVKDWPCHKLSCNK